MVTWWWSWLLMTVGIVGLYLSGSHKSTGWLIGLGAQVLWFTYALSTQQHGFMVSSLAYGSVYLRNYLRWRRENTQPQPAIVGSRRERRRAWRARWGNK